MDENVQPWRTESEFVRFLATLLLNRYPDAIIQREAPVAQRLRPDITMHRGDDVYIIEAKRETPFTINRLLEVRHQLTVYREAAVRMYRNKRVRSVLAIPGVLSADKLDALADLGFEVWDKLWIERAVDGGPGASGFVPDRIGQCRLLRDSLPKIRPGRRNWVEYQRACMEAWELLFFPQLSRPIGESENESGVNRRDFVVPNYATEGFWAFMRDHYRADYVVVDAKNLVGLAGKGHILQISNYMSRHGTGLFGVIMTRRGNDRAALYTRREQWVLHSKMLIVLNDDDAVQMLDNVISGDDPALVIRQKIEDFRLSI